jgi:hypothetical protein
MKQKISTEKVNIQTADPKANASVFLFFSTTHFLKIILANRTNGTFGFARHTNRPFATAEQSRTPLKINYDVSKTKRAIFCQRPQKNIDKSKHKTTI